jgi:hypothetical protein
MLSGSGRMRLGGREERRAVYGHFLAAMTQFEVDLGNYLVTFPLTRNRARHLNTAAGPLHQAMAEVKLVGNDGPLQVAEDWYALRGKIILHVNSDRSGLRRWRRGDPELSDMLRAHQALREKFVQECRVDLLYLPRWWQVWRPRWWMIRWNSYRSREFR